MNFQSFQEIGVDLLRKIFSADILKIINPLALLDETTRLIKNYLNSAYFQETKLKTNQTLEGSTIPVRFMDDNPIPIDIEDIGKKGQIILELYFHQIFYCDTIILAIDKKDFIATNSPEGNYILAWKPSPLYIQWKEDFLWAIRGIYYGSYFDKEPIFQSALASIGISGAEKIFRDHLGYGKISGKLFDKDQAKSIFSKLFRYYWNNNLPLPKDLISFSTYLAILYFHLEHLGLEFYPKTALENVTKGQDWEKLLVSKFSKDSNLEL